MVFCFFLNCIKHRLQLFKLFYCVSIVFKLNVLVVLFSITHNDPVIAVQ